MQAPKCPIVTPIAVDPGKLPDFLPIALVSVICGLSVPTIRYHVRQGTFPQPIKLTPKKLFWRKADVLQFFSLPRKENNE